MSDYRDEFEKELENQDIEYCLTVTSKNTGELLYKYSSFLLETVSQALFSAEKAVTKYIDGILQDREAKYLSDESERDADTER